MIQLDKVDTSIFCELIGFEIDTISSAKLKIYHDEVISYERSLVITLKKPNKIKHLYLDNNFIENDFGDVFYDYRFQTDQVNQEFFNAELHLETSAIIEIEIFSRLFDPIDFSNWPEIYNRYKKYSYTDDVFLFRCKNGEQILLIFNPFFPQTQVIFKNDSISKFWSSYAGKYTMRYRLF